MIGIENITNNNGWAMAAVGATIVFSGLVVLSFVISQIHKLLKIWDDRGKLLERFKKKTPLVVAVKSLMRCNVFAPIKYLDTIYIQNNIDFKIGI